MFLPVLLVRDYGVWGWIVFAVPNVIGAAAMGWVLKSPRSSIELARKHREACTYFSAVTIAFHFFFVLIVIAPLASAFAPRQAVDLALGSVLAGGILMFILMTRQRGADRGLAIFALLISLGAMGGTIFDIARTPEEVPQLGASFAPDLLWLAPVCCFGFALCPYLDLTFHRARQNSSSPKSSFGVGFGVLFLAMIVFTLIYSKAIHPPNTQLLSGLLVVHMTVQTAFTIAAHSRELQYAPPRAAIIATVLTALSWVALWCIRRTDLGGQIDPAELIYRVFMGFYGLVFPAYVWLVIVPGTGPNRRNLVVFAVAVLLAMPMFWMGFVLGRMIWLVPGLATVLLARLLVGRISAPQQNSAPI
ncbi:MAG TPA: hypothetical protein VH518_05460 [Tepidisphaeraceae bacterium]|jgi:hypothetical protein